jgi:hypothetical protein
LAAPHPLRRFDPARSAAPDDRGRHGLPPHALARWSIRSSPLLEPTQDPTSTGDRLEEDRVEQCGEVIGQCSAVPSVGWYGLELDGEAVGDGVEPGILSGPLRDLREVAVEVADARVVELLVLHLHVERHPVGQLGGHEDPGVPLGVHHPLRHADAAEAVEVGDRFRR